MKKMYSYMTEVGFNADVGVSVNRHTVTQAVPCHWHDYIEIELITSGSGTQVLNGKDEKLCRGCITLVRTTDFHTVIPDGELKLINLMVDDRYISEDVLSMLVISSELFFRLTEAEVSVFEHYISLLDEVCVSATSNTDYAKNLIKCFFMRFLQLVSVKGAAFKTVGPIQFTLLYMNMHFRESPPLSVAAELAGYNITYFCTVFKNEIGMSYSEYLNMLKINYAKELLLSTDLKISEICFECGFRSLSNFQKVFKLKTGISPKEYKTSKDNI